VDSLRRQKLQHQPFVRTQLRSGIGGCCCSEKETRSHLEHERGPTDLGWHWVSMTDRTSRFLERTTLAHKPTCSLWGSRRTSPSAVCLRFRTSADCAEIGDHFRRNLKHRRPKILPKMLDRRCSRDHHDIGRPLQKPSQRDLHGRGTEACGDIGEGSRLEWSEPAEWKERHVGDTVTSKIGYKCIIGSMREG
jgi:hypothetical protein